MRLKFDVTENLKKKIWILGGSKQDLALHIWKAASKLWQEHSPQKKKYGKSICQQR